MVEKITIENLRREALNAICDERKSIIISRKRKLQELYAVCRHVERSKEFPNADIIATWGTVEDYGGANMEDAEKRFLGENDIEKGRLFNESTLPQHSSYLPEPGGFSKATPTPTNLSVSPGVVTPTKPTIQSSSATSTPTIEKSPQVPSDSAISQEAEFPVEKKRRTTNDEPVRLERAVETPLSNGNKENVNPDTSSESASASENHQAKLTPASTQTTSPLAVEETQLDSSAPIVNVGGVPVLETTTTAPDEKDAAFGVAPPPIPAALAEREDEDVTMDDTSSSDKPLTASAETVDDLAQLKQATSIAQTEPEVPDSQEASLSPIPTSPAARPTTTIFEHLEEARLPANNSQIQQLPPHAPLLVVTGNQNRPSPIPFVLARKDPLLYPEVSSPTSSVDGGDGFGSPGNAALSSATSPDASHITLEVQLPNGEKADTREVVSEISGDRIQTVSAEQAGEDEDAGAVAEKAPECCGERPEGELPSISAAEEVAQAEAEVEPSLPTIPPQAGLADEANILAQEREEIANLPESVPESETVLSPPLTQESAVVPPKDQEPTTPSLKPIDASIAVLSVGQPKSPDPSAQLRLEHQLANGAPVPAAAIGTAEKPVLALTETKVELELVLTQPHDEEEEEDQVQLVGSREPEPLSARRKSPMEVPAQAKVEMVEAVKEMEEVLETKVEEVPIHVSTPEPEVGVPAEVGEETSEPEAEEEDGEEEEEEKDEDQNEDEEEEEDEGEGEEEEEKLAEDVVMEEAERDQPESISVPYQPSPEAETENEVEDETAQEPEEEEDENEDADGEDEKTDLAEETVPEVSVDPIVKPPTEEPNISRSESLSEKPIEPTFPTPEIPDTRASEQTLSVNFNLPTPDATDVRPSAPASAKSISPQRPKSSKALGRIKERERSRSKLRKVVISSAHHAAAAAKAEAQRLREDQENQGMIVVARRRDQAAAARGRSAPFPPGSKTEAMTRYGIADPPLIDGEKRKNAEIFDVLYTVKSAATSAKELISRASKTVSTSNHQVHYFESQAARILEMIQKNQDLGNSSLRQITRAREPKRRKCHWDYLLEEAKWLREDFREERRWKIAVAKQVVEWCVEWHEAGEDRRELCVDRRRWGRVPKGIREERRKTANGGDVDMAGAGGFSEFNEPTPELVDGGATPEDEGSEDYFPRGDEHAGTVGWGTRDFFGYLQDPPPAALFTLSPEETIFGVAPTKAAEDMLGQLPLFAPPKPPNLETRRFEHVDEEWMTPVIPVIKYCSGKLSLLQEEEGPPRKKSRYEYEENYELFADDSDEDDALGGGAYIGRHGKREKDKTRKPVPLPPEQTDVALFSPTSKSLLQRIHNAHLFRPPSDLPPAAFFESRTPSLWTSAEDEMLKQLAREYHHNWSLVATCMALEGTWHSGSERRSPWECFERWIGLEPVSQEFMKSPYYKPVQQRLDIAARVGGVYVANPGSAGGSNPGGVTKRRGTVPVKVEKRRVTKYFNIFEAMRKLAKKRETSISKQQSGRAAQMAAMRKAQDPPNNAATQRTPAFFSQLKYDRELKALEQKAMYSAHLQTMQARGQPVAPQAGRLHPAQQQAIANGVPIPGQRIPQAAGMPNGLPPGARPSPSVQHAMPNGGVPVGMNGVPMNARMHPQAQTQAQGRPMTPEQIQQLQLLRAQAAKQAQAQQAAGYQQGQSGSVAGMQAGFPIPANAANQQKQLFQQAQQAALGGQKIPSVPNGQAGSPRMQNQALNPQQQQQQGPARGQLQLTAAEMTALVHHQNPHLPQDQVAKATAQHLASYHQQLTQNMVARGANGNVQGGQNMASSPTNQALISQQLLQRVQAQQAQQAQARAAAANTGPMISANGPVGPGTNASRSATPQQQRSASAASPMSVQQSPRLGQAMLAGQQQGQGQGQ